MTAKETTKRYTVMSVPKNDDAGAFWFVVDLKDRKTIEMPTLHAANAHARELNAADVANRK